MFIGIGIYNGKQLTKQFIYEPIHIYFYVSSNNNKQHQELQVHLRRD